MKNIESECQIDNKAKPENLFNITNIQRFDDYMMTN